MPCRYTSEAENKESTTFELIINQTFLSKLFVLEPCKCNVINAPQFTGAGGSFRGRLQFETYGCKEVPECFREIDRGAGGETAWILIYFWFKRFCKMDRGPKQSHEDGVMKCCWLCRWKVKMWTAEWNVIELGDRAEIRESWVVRWSELPHQHPASPLCWWCCCG